MHSDATRLVCRSRTLDLSEPLVMGIVNVTPDSFSDGGRYHGTDAAVSHALAMIEQGAAIVDVGGESTRPGAAPIPADEERRRVLPVIERLVRVAKVPISIDTSDPSLMTDAVAAGAEIINDVRALRRDGALEATARSGAGICLMHMQGDPASMQADPRYGDVVAEVAGFLRERLNACAAAGISPERVCIDPGIGFGKTHEHNLRLLAELATFRELGRPILVGVSRKSVVGIITKRPLGERAAGSSALAALAIERGARIIRAHDVAATVDAVRIAAALCRAEGSERR
jgi:dihydropteroate synthase